MTWRIIIWNVDAVCVCDLVARQPEHSVQPHELSAAAVRRGPWCPHCHVSVLRGAPGSSPSPSAAQLHGAHAWAEHANPNLLHSCARPSARQPAGDAAAGIHAAAYAAGKPKPRYLTLNDQCQDPKMGAMLRKRSSFDIRTMFDDMKLTLWMRWSSVCFYKVVFFFKHALKSIL